jgi:hypothetical protein
MLSTYTCNIILEYNNLPILPVSAKRDIKREKLEEIVNFRQEFPSHRHLPDCLLA